MSMTKDNLKIGQEEFNRTKIATLSDRPNVGSAVGGNALSPAQMKKRYDASAELIVQRFNAFIDALAGYNEQGERIEGVADLIQTGLGENYSLANLFAGLSTGEAAQRIRVGIEQYTLKGFLEHLNQQLEVVGEDYKQLDDAVGKAEDAANRAEQTVNDAAASVVNEAKAAAAAAAEAAIGDELESAKNAATAAQAAASTAERTVKGAVADAVADAEEKLEQAVADASAVAQAAEQNAKQAAEEAKRAAETAGGANIFANALKGSATGSVVRMGDVSPVEHDMAVRVSGVDDVSAVKVQRYGKNLLKYPYKDGSKTINGVTFTVNDDGTVLVNGTATDEAAFELYAPSNITQLIANTEADLFLSGCPEGGSEKTFYIFDGWVGRKDTGKGVVLTKGGNRTKQIKIIVENGVTMNNALFKPQIEVGTSKSEYAPYIEPTEYTPNADGTVEGVTSLSPTTTLMTDTVGAVIDVEYNRDLNKAFNELQDLCLEILYKYIFGTQA